MDDTGYGMDDTEYGIDDTGVPDSMHAWAPKNAILTFEIVGSASSAACSIWGDASKGIGNVVSSRKERVNVPLAAEHVNRWISFTWLGLDTVLAPYPEYDEMYMRNRIRRYENRKKGNARLTDWYVKLSIEI